MESSTSQGRSLERILSKVKHVCTVKHTSFTMKIAKEYATSDSKVTRNGSVPSRKTQNAPQRTHLMDFFSKKLGLTWGHIYQHHSCIKKSFKQKKKLANFMNVPPTVATTILHQFLLAQKGLHVF